MSPADRLVRPLGFRRFCSGARWWRFFAMIAVVAGVHDWMAHARPTSAWADSPRETTGANENGAGENETHTAGTHDEPHADDHGGGHHDPAAPVLLAIVVIILAAKLAGDVFDRLSLPAVLGELLVGVLLGNANFLLVGLFGVEFHALEFLLPPEDPPHASAYHTGAVLQILASIGVVLLLFEVGLESSVEEMMSVGLSSAIVAILGVVVPIALGYGVSMWLLPEGFSGGLRHSAAAFIGATLCATSVGITARVLKDLGRSQQAESRIILGAAVVDDVLGLIVLAVVSGIIAVAGTSGSEAGPTSPGSAIVASAEGSVPETSPGASEPDETAGHSTEKRESSLAWQVTKIVLLAFGFLAGALLLGAMQFQRLLFKAASGLRGHGMLIATSLVICFGFSYMANLVGLATIVGAFAAGLILEGAHYRELGERENRHLEEALAPLSGLLVPIFFVDMGLQVQLESFTKPSVWALASGITIVAIVGKQICSLGVVEKGYNRLAVGLGMIPRGEVGLIFANEGKKLVFDGTPVIDANTYSAVIVMVMITTMVTPPLLKWALVRGDAGPDPSEA